MISKVMLVTAFLAMAPAAAFAQGEPPPPPLPTSSPPAAMPGDSISSGVSPGIFRHGTLGLSFGLALNGGSDTLNGGQPTPEINLLYFIDDRSALDLIAGFDLRLVSGQNGAPDLNTFGFVVGAGYRMYRRHASRIHTFFEPQVLLSVPHASVGSELTLAVAAVGGVECMFTEWFSVRGQAGLQLDFRNKFNDIELSSGTTGLYANFYWD